MLIKFNNKKKMYIVSSDYLYLLIIIVIYSDSLYLYITDDKVNYKSQILL